MIHMWGRKELSKCCLESENATSVVGSMWRKISPKRHFGIEHAVLGLFFVWDDFSSVLAKIIPKQGTLEYEHVNWELVFVSDDPCATAKITPKRRFVIEHAVLELFFYILVFELSWCESESVAKVGKGNLVFIFRAKQQATPLDPGRRLVGFHLHICHHRPEVLNCFAVVTGLFASVLCQAVKEVVILLGNIELKASQSLTSMQRKTCSWVTLAQVASYDATPCLALVLQPIQLPTLQLVIAHVPPESFLGRDIPPRHTHRYQWQVPEAPPLGRWCSCESV